MPDPPADAAPQRSATAAPPARWLPVALQAAASAGYGVVELTRTRSSQHGDAGGTAAIGAYFMVFAVLVAFLAAGLRRGRRWARGPAVTLEIIAVPIAVTMLRGHVWVPGVLLLVLAVVELAALIAQARAESADGTD